MISDIEWAQTGFPEDELIMLKDAYKAITLTGMWSWFAGYQPPEGEGFAFTTHPNMKKIEEAMEYKDHSGFSYSWTMRQMQCIAKEGWENYIMLHNPTIKFDHKMNDIQISATKAVHMIAESMTK